MAHALTENRGVSFPGGMKNASFIIPGATGRRWLATGGNPNGRPNSDVLRPWITGLDITGRPTDTWIVDFGVDRPLSDARCYVLPFEHVSTQLKPARAAPHRRLEQERWWLHAHAAPELRQACRHLPRFIATAHLAKHRLFIWVSPPAFCDEHVVLIPRADDTTFGILQSRFHELWSRHMETSPDGLPRTTPATPFDTFPFPAGLTPRDTAPAAAAASPPCLAEQILAENIAATARNLNRLRDAWLNPAEWVDWEITPEEEAAGFPARPVAKPGHGAELKKHTLTKLYNDRPAWLDLAHKALDQAVAAAYGWPDYTDGMADAEILRRVLALNLERARGQGR